MGLRADSLALIAAAETERNYWHRIEVEHALATIGAAKGRVAEVIKASTALQLQGMGALAQSQVHIHGELRAVSAAMRDLIEVTGHGFAELAGSIETGLNSVAEEIGSLRSEVAAIQEILESPASVQADEYRRRGEFALAEAVGNTGADREKWLADALEDFRLAVRKNKYDPTLHFNIGYINLAQGQTAAAAEFFTEAARYAKSKSPKYQAYALRHLAHTHYVSGHIPSATERIRESLALSPEIAETRYEAARYYAKLAGVAGTITSEVALRELNLAIAGDPRFSVICLAEEDFTPITHDLAEFISRLTRLMLSLANSEMSFASSFQSRLAALQLQPFDDFELTAAEKALPTALSYPQLKEVRKHLRNYLTSRLEAVLKESDIHLRIANNKSAVYADSQRRVKRATDEIKKAKVVLQQFMVVAVVFLVATVFIHLKFSMPWLTLAATIVSIWTMVRISASVKVGPAIDAVVDMHSKAQCELLEATSREQQAANEAAEANALESRYREAKRLANEAQAFKFQDAHSEDTLFRLML